MASLPALRLTFLLRSVLLSAGLAAFNATLSADTVGYWRFENSGSLGADSSGNNITLTNNNTVGSVTPSPFGTTVPATGAANTRAATFVRSASKFLSTGDRSAFAFQDFTFEAYVNLASGTTGNTFSVIGGQLNDNGANNAAWHLGVTGETSGFGARNLLLQMSQTGTGSLISFDSDYQLIAGNNYYLAASVDFRASDTQVTFFFQDLTAGTALVSNSVTLSTITGLYNSGTNFTLGASYSNGTISRFFDGTIDEARLSNTALGSSALLATVPEPSTYALFAGAAMLGAVILRRRSARAPRA